MKNMEMVLATKFSSPTATKTKAMATVTRVLLKGSLDTGFPCENQILMNLVGNILSSPIACSVLGATMMDPIAEEMVAAD